MDKEFKRPVVLLLSGDAKVRRLVADAAASLEFEETAFSNAESLLENWDTQSIGCVVAETPSALANLLEFQQQLAGLANAPPLVCLASEGGAQVAAQAMARGAFYCLFRPCNAADMKQAIERAVAFHHRQHLEQEQLLRVKALIDGLNVNERRVLARLLEGQTNKQIARQLDIAQRSVERARAKLIEKFEVRSALEVVRIVAEFQALAKARDRHDLLPTSWD